jgi:hypothetical protein
MEVKFLEQSHSTGNSNLECVFSLHPQQCDHLHIAFDRSGVKLFEIIFFILSRSQCFFLN